MALFSLLGDGWSVCWLLTVLIGYSLLAVFLVICFGEWPSVQQLRESACSPALCFWFCLCLFVFFFLISTPPRARSNRFVLHSRADRRVQRAYKADTTDRHLFGAWIAVGAVACRAIELVAAAHQVRRARVDLRALFAVLCAHHPVARVQHEHSCIVFVAP